jgi:hypothetical protein
VAAQLRAELRQEPAPSNQALVYVAQVARQATIAAAHADELSALAERVANIKQWTVTLEEVQDAEKAALKKKFPGLEADDLRRLVDERYQEMLTASP